SLHSKVHPPAIFLYTSDRFSQTQVYKKKTKMATRSALQRGGRWETRRKTKEAEIFGPAAWWKRIDEIWQRRRYCTSVWSYNPWVNFTQHHSVANGCDQHCAPTAQQCCVASDRSRVYH